MSNKKQTILKPILWPPSSPRAADGQENRIWWLILCVLLVIPFGTIFHHTIFYRFTCTLNPFGADYYLPSVLYAWLSRDPSLPWAIVTAVFVYSIGKRYRKIKLLSASIFVSFLPLSFWIWGIPFTGHLICDYFHDDRLLIFGHSMKTSYLYLLGIFIYASFLTKMMDSKQNT